MRFGTGLLLLAMLASACPSAPPLESVSDGRYAMGTVLEISVAAPPDRFARADLEALFDQVAELEAIFSGYDPESALSRLNRAAGQGPVAVPPELARILGDAQALARLTRGSFDVSVGPLVALWREAAGRDRAPSASELTRARTRVGTDKLRLHGGNRVELAAAGMELDLGGVAKGWALDRVAERLRARGVERALLSFGQSSVVALGEAPEGGGWNLFLRSSRGPAGIIRLRDQALSVSDSLGQWSEIGGRRYGHVVDPRTGQALTRTCLATVVAPSAAEAEAWTKALLVLGPEAGIALLEARPGAEGRIEDESQRSWETTGWRAAVDFQAF